MLLPNRHGSSNSYRYGFQGQEKDDEVKGEGNSLSFDLRHYDTRIGRWLSRDPLFSPWESPYAANRNNPINEIDPDGGWSIKHHRSGRYRDKNGKVTSKVSFQYSFNAAKRNSSIMLGASKIGYFPVVGATEGISKIGLGIDTKNPQIVVSGVVDLVAGFFGGEIAKAGFRGAKAGKNIVTAAEEVKSFAISELSTEVIDETLLDSGQEFFIDGFIESVFKADGIVDDYGNFTEKYINKIKKKYIEEKGYDINKKADMSKLSQDVETRLNKEAEKVEIQALEVIKGLKKEKEKRRQTSIAKERKKIKRNKK